MKVLFRFLLEVLLFVVLFPVIMLIEVVWFIYCIRAAIILDASIKEGVNTWARYLKEGLKMNADFVKNGL